MPAPLLIWLLRSRLFLIFLLLPADLARSAQPPPEKRAEDAVRELAGHGDEIICLVFSPDGKTLASASPDDDIRLWDVANGKIRLRICHKKGPVLAVAFSRDGKLLASAGAPDGSINIWDASSGKPIRQLIGHRDGVTSLSFSPDGKLLASGSYDKTIRLWDFNLGQEVRRCEGHTDGRVTSVAFSPDGKQLVSGGTRKIEIRGGDIRGASGTADALHLWDADAGKLLRKLSWCGSVVAFTADGRTLAAGGLVHRLTQGGEMADGSDLVSFVDPTTGQAFFTIPWRGGAVAVSADGHMIVTAGGSLVHMKGFGLIAYNNENRHNKDHGVRLWDASSCKEIKRITGKSASAVAFSPAGRTLAVGATRGEILLYDLLRAEAKPFPAARDELEKTLAGLWKDLGDDDPRIAYRAMWTMTASPSEAIRYLRDRLSARNKPEAEDIRKLIVRLRAEDFKVREGALEALKQYDRGIEPALRESLQSNPPLDVRLRLEEILNASRTKALSSGQSREVRAVQVLENIASSESRTILDRLARGSPHAVVTQCSQGALKRLNDKGLAP
jgi:WD40 repeat protein